MNDLEFENAPEGATHFGVVRGDIVFYRDIDSDGYECFCIDGHGWLTGYGEPSANKLYPIMLKPDLSWPRKIYHLDNPFFPPPDSAPDPEGPAESARSDGSTDDLPSKYHRRLPCGTVIDIYDVLVAWSVTNPADAHAIKKMLMPGKRGHKDAIKDRQEAIASLHRAIEIEKANLQFLEALPESQSPFVVPTLQLKSIE